MLWGVIKVSLEGQTRLAGGCWCRQHPVTWEDEDRGTWVHVSQHAGCIHAGRHRSFAAPVNWRRLRSGMTPGRHQAGTDSESCVRSGLENQLETGNTVPGSLGILSWDLPALPRLLGGHPEHTAPHATVPKSSGWEEGEGSNGEIPSRAGERKGIAHSRFIWAPNA